MADKIKQVADALDMLAEDTSVPRNIRKGASDAKIKLTGKEALDVRVNGAINILATLTEDLNMPSHGRTLAYNIMIQLEVIGKSA